LPLFVAAVARLVSCRKVTVLWPSTFQRLGPLWPAAMASMVQGVS
jgi:hypothetical protein